jgi:hypothetical protein
MKSGAGIHCIQSILIASTEIRGQPAYTKKNARFHALGRGDMTTTVSYLPVRKRMFTAGLAVCGSSKASVAYQIQYSIQMIVYEW